MQCRHLGGGKGAVAPNTLHPKLVSYFCLLFSHDMTLRGKMVKKIHDEA